MTSEGQEHSPRIAVLVACYNRAAITLPNIAALEAALEGAECRFDIHLLDDASPDQTGPRVKAAHPRINVVISEGDLFWNRGMQRIFEVARAQGPYDAYLLFNDDVLVDREAVARAVALWTSLNREGPAALIGATRDGKHTRTTYSGHRLTDPGQLILTMVEPGEEARSCDTFNANFVLVPAASLEELGGLDPYYWHGYGDYDLGFSLRKRGERVLLAPGWIGTCEGHLMPVPSRHGLWRRLKAGMSGREDPRQRVYMIWKHSSSRPAALFAISLVLIKRVRILVLNRPHVAALSADAKR